MRNEGTAETSQSDLMSLTDEMLDYYHIRAKRIRKNKEKIYASQLGII